MILGSKCCLHILSTLLLIFNPSLTPRLQRCSVWLVSEPSGGFWGIESTSFPCFQAVGWVPTLVLNQSPLLCWHPGFHSHTVAWPLHLLFCLSFQLYAFKIFLYCCLNWISGVSRDHCLHCVLFDLGDQECVLSLLLNSNDKVPYDSLCFPVSPLKCKPLMNYYFLVPFSFVPYSILISLTSSLASDQTINMEPAFIYHIHFAPEVATAAECWWQGPYFKARWKEKCGWIVISVN